MRKQWQFLKMSVTFHMTQQFHSYVFTLKVNEPNKNVCINVHSGIIQNSPKVKTT